MGLWQRSMSEIFLGNRRAWRGWEQATDGFQAIRLSADHFFFFFFFFLNSVIYIPLQLLLQEQDAAGFLKSLYK